jgi:hypothetical protein
MTTASQASSVHPLLPYEVPPRRLLLASGVHAGDWIFASGLLPTRFSATARPLSGEPAWTTQCRSLPAGDAGAVRAEGPGQVWRPAPRGPRAATAAPTSRHTVGCSRPWRPPQ